MKELFSEQVRLVQRGPKGNKKRAYLNLQRIQRIDRVSTSLSTSSLLLPNGWHPIKDGFDQISFIRHEGWEFSNRRGIIELRVTQNTPSNITFKLTFLGTGALLHHHSGGKKWTLRILTDINSEDMNCNNSAHIQFASHLVVVNDTSYTCTFLQNTADLIWMMHNQASWVRSGSFLGCFTRQPQWNTVVNREKTIRYVIKFFPVNI